MNAQKNKSNTFLIRQHVLMFSAWSDYVPIFGLHAATAILLTYN